MHIGKLIVAIFLLFVNVSAGRADVYNAASEPRVTETLPDDGVIDENVILVGKINIDGATTITARGTIYASIDVCRNCELKIRISGNGSFNGTVSLQEGARLTQLISKDEDIIAPNFGDTPFGVLVDGADNLSLDKIVDATAGAASIKLHGGTFVVDDVAAVRSATVILSGHITIFLSHAADLIDAVLFTNAYGDGDIYLYADDLGPLHGLHAYVDTPTGRVMVSRVRILDYSQIFDDARGDFLNDLREYNPADKLLRAMDAANTLDELNSIIRRSVRLNPINLMRPVRMLNLAVQNATPFDGDTSGMFAAPLILSGGDMEIYAVRGGVHGRVDESLSLAVTAYGAMVEYEDDINEFYTGVVGANIAAHYDADVVFLRGLLGLTVASFDAGPIFDGRAVHFNPMGVSGYGFSDLGHRFDFSRGFYVSPFAGLGFLREYLLDATRDRNFARVGMDAGVKLDYGDLIYDYAMRVTGTTASSVAVDLRMSAWSPFDAAGGDFSVGIVRDGDMRAYSFSVGARFQF